MRQNYYPNSYIGYNKPKSRSKTRLILILIALGVGGYLVFQFVFKSPSALVINPLPSPNSQTNNSQPLSETIQGALEGTRGTYAIVIKNLKTGEVFTKDQDKQFESGSLYKLWVMAEAYKQIEEGSLKEDEVLSQDIATLNQKFGISPEDAELTEGGITLTVSSAIQQMITISHNYAALLLTEKLKLSSVAKFLENNGFSHSSVGVEGEAPTTTPSDIALFLEKLYKGELANPEDTTKMIDFLKKQKLNDKLPKYLPSEVQIAHKTGEIGWFSHDAGIVFTEKGDYIIVVFSETDAPPAAEDRIAKISQATYQYFEQKP